MPLDRIHNKMLNVDDLDQQTADAIVSLYNRLGMEDSDQPADLAEYRNTFTPPFTVHRVVRCGWCV